MCSIFKWSLHVVRIQRASLIVIMDNAIIWLMLFIFIYFAPLTPRWLIYLALSQEYGVFFIIFPLTYTLDLLVNVITFTKIRPIDYLLNPVFVKPAGKFLRLIQDLKNRIGLSGST
jgi:hypothetical protein